MSWWSFLNLNIGNLTANACLCIFSSFSSYPPCSFPWFLPCLYMHVGAENSLLLVLVGFNIIWSLTISRHRWYQKCDDVWKEWNSHSPITQMPPASLSALILHSAQNLLYVSASSLKRVLLLPDELAVRCGNQPELVPRKLVLITPSWKPYMANPVSSCFQKLWETWKHRDKSHTYILLTAK